MSNHESTTTSLAGDGVDTKSEPRGRFGNDGRAVDIKSKQKYAAASIGFVRVRKRELKGPYWRGYGRNGYWASSSVSFDVVKAVRVGGKPRHQFVLGLGSQKNNVTGRGAAFTLLCAIGRMKRHGLTESQRRALLAEMIRKGARRPTIADCEGWKHISWMAGYVDELAASLRAP